MFAGAHLQLDALERHPTVGMHKVELIKRDAHDPRCFMVRIRCLLHLKKDKAFLLQQSCRYRCFFYAVVVFLARGYETRGALQGQYFFVLRVVRIEF